MEKLNLRQAREKAGFTREYVAEQAGVSIDTVQNWEFGITSPSMKLGMYLAVLYGMSVNDITFIKSAQTAI